MKLTLGIDQSKRCTACVVLDDEARAYDWCLICPPHEIDGVELIEYQWSHLFSFIQKLPTEIDAAVIEGLSFGAVGSGKDMLAALNWVFRWKTKVEFDLFLGPVPVSAWRSKVLTKEEQRIAKASGKDGLKYATVNKLPDAVTTDFLEYVDKCKEKIMRAKDPKWKPTSKTMKYKEAMFDLADAYFLAKYRMSI